MTDYERFGDYRSSEKNVAGVALTFLFIGLGLGAVAALMLAPRSGKQIRRQLRRRYEDARERFEDFGEQAGDVMERGGEWAKTAKRKVAPIAERMRR